MDKIKTAQEMWHAWVTGVHDDVLRYVHEDVQLRPLEASFNTYVGLAEVASLRQALEDRGIQIASTPFTWEQHGDDVIVQGRSRVTVSGHGADGDWCWLLHFEGEKVALIQTFPDYEQACEFSRQAQSKSAQDRPVS